MSRSEGEDPIAIATRVFDTLRTEFPALAMKSGTPIHSVDFAFSIPRQPGLVFDVEMNLQNGDELQMNIDAFWGYWFPCTDPLVERRFLDAVRGLLTGRYRIAVYSRRGRAYTCLLQAPKGDGWETAYAARSLHWPCWNPDIRYVQNARAEQV
ncbi:MAG: hypothetical protein AAGA11_19735 [Pseudomonadota bacterium]